MTVAPVRFAMAIVSPTWSPWPCETRMKSACTWSAVMAAGGIAGEERIDEDLEATGVEREGGVSEPADGGHEILHNNAR